MDRNQNVGDESFGLSEIVEIIESLNSTEPNTNMNPTTAQITPYIRIIEQPEQSLRFRYKSECRTAGTIKGINSTDDVKTLPTIEVVGYAGPAKIIVSCVTKDKPYRTHPHGLVSKENCREGVCIVKLNGPPMRAVFNNLGIQCCKKNEVQGILEKRKERKIDPFNAGYDSSNVDLNSIRLCFQAILYQNPQKPLALEPVVSEPIADKKADLKICRLCSCSAKVSGGDQIILLCEYLPINDLIQIKFSENSSLWTDYGKFERMDIHKNTAITFKTPRYSNTDIKEPVSVNIQLVRPSTNEVSKPLPFTFYPDTDEIKKKRLSAGNNEIFRQVKRKLQENLELPFFNNTNNILINSPTVIKQENALGTDFDSHRSPYSGSHSPNLTSPMEYQRKMPYNHQYIQMGPLSNSSSTSSVLNLQQQHQIENLQQQQLNPYCQDWNMNTNSNNLAQCSTPSPVQGQTPNIFYGCNDNINSNIIPSIQNFPAFNTNIRFNAPVTSGGTITQINDIGINNIITHSPMEQQAQPQQIPDFNTNHVQYQTQVPSEISHTEFQCVVGPQVHIFEKESLSDLNLQSNDMEPLSNSDLVSMLDQANL